LGCDNFGWRTDQEESRKVVHKALDLGVTLFDTADIYGDGRSEEILGAVLASRRPDVVVATKFGWPFPNDARGPSASRDYIIKSVEASLRRLGTEWIDLYQIHCPDRWTPMDETLCALDDLVRQGKVRYIGICNHAAWQVVDAIRLSQLHRLQRFASCQDEYSLLVRGIERETLPAIQKFGLGLFAYFPLASGLLTGKYQRNAPLPPDSRFASQSLGWLGPRYLTDSNWDMVAALSEHCVARGQTLLQLAIGWLAAKPMVSSILIGATKPEQVEQNVAAIGVRVDAEDLVQIDRVTEKAKDKVRNPILPERGTS
jgi:aryl-alcohol dehydrogenase-like predicted oxidoreductase